MDLAALIRNVPDFPKPGIQFKDITTLLLEPAALKEVTRIFEERYREKKIDAIVGVESRGFIFGATLAYALDLPLVLARKKGKLPADTISVEFSLEYGVDTVEMHKDALKPGQNVLIIDDLLATGGTVAAVAELVRKLQANIVGAAFVVELPPLKGREKLPDIAVDSLVEFMVD